MYRGLGSMGCSVGGGFVMILQASGQRLIDLLNHEMVRAVRIFCCRSKICLNNTWWHIWTSVFQQQGTCSGLECCYSIS
jgi:hypothetical protein